MILSNINFDIEITKDTQYTLFSTDNKFYTHVTKMEDYNKNDFVCAYCVSVHSSISDYTVAFIGRACGSVENCAVLEDNRLVILIDDFIAIFDLIAEKLEKKIKILDFGTGIEIYSFDDGYIVNGESSIKILSDSLLLTDFEGYTYHLDKFGKEIS